MRISFGEVRIGDLARKYVSEALDANWVSSGRQVDAFESEFAKHFGYRHAMAVSSGTDAVTATISNCFEYVSVSASATSRSMFSMPSCANLPAEAELRSGNISTLVTWSARRDMQAAR